MRADGFLNGMEEMLMSEVKASTAEVRSQLAQADKHYHLGAAGADANKLEYGWKYFFTSERGKKPSVEIHLKRYMQKRDSAGKEFLLNLYAVLYQKETQIEAAKMQYAEAAQKIKGIKDKKRRSYELRKLKETKEEISRASAIIRKYKPQFKGLIDTGYVEGIVRKYEAELKKVTGRYIM